MLRAATPCSKLFALLASSALAAIAQAGTPPSEAPRPDVSLQVVVLSATGRADKPQFDPRTPSDLRKQIEGQNLAYGKYEVLGIQRKDAGFGADVAFDLPEKHTLVIKPSLDESRPNRLRLGCRLLDGQNKPVLVNTMRVSYDRTFIIQRSKGPGSSVLMGISACKPSDAPRK
ncbi:MAG TPA: hypothetical protein VNE39_25580 [Planctomycetota bacterium]|nr:hypothetical protein [Planctomycetota bacterium]